jgi:hypothetical protein
MRLDSRGGDRPAPTPFVCHALKTLSMGSNAEGRTDDGIMQVDGHETGLEPELV